MKTYSTTERIVAFSDFFEIGGVQRWMGEMMLGVFYSLENRYLIFNSPLLLAVGYVSTFLLLCYLQAVNDYFDVDIDKVRLEYTKKYSGLSKKGLIIGERISKVEASFSIVFLSAVGLALSVLVSTHFLIISLLIVLMATLYSAPPVRYKEIYLFSTLGEIIGNFLPFLVGYAVFNPIDWRAILVAAIPATSGTNNRFRHEIKMIEFDRSFGKKTIAVVHGLQTAKVLAKACVLLNLVEILVFSFLFSFPLRFLLLLLLYMFLAYALWYGFLKGLVRKIFGLSWGFMFSLLILLYL